MIPVLAFALVAWVLLVVLVLGVCASAQRDDLAQRRESAEEDTRHHTRRAGGTGRERRHALRVVAGGLDRNVL
jgi:hypothetical protein